MDPEPARALMQSSGLSARGKAVLASAFSGSIWTCADLAAAGYEVEDRCPLCRAAADTLEHRIWHCNAPEAIAERSKVPSEVVMEARRDPRTALITMLRAPTVDFRHPPPAQDPPTYIETFAPGPGVWSRVEGKPNLDEADEPILFIDGSCFPVKYKSGWRAGWSNADISHRSGQPLMRMFGAVPGYLPQTAPGAEWFAALQAASWWAGSRGRPAADCKQVVDAVSSSDVLALLRKGTFHCTSLREIWQRTASFPGPPMTLRKVAAHQAEPDRENDFEAWIDWKGNDIADTAAKEGAALHPKAASGEYSCAIAEWGYFLDVGRAIATMLPLWPSAGQRYGQRLQPPPRQLHRRPRVRGRAAPVNRHDFQACAGKLLCSTCLAFARCHANARARTEAEECPGASQVLAAALRANDTGHSLLLASFSGQAVVVCLRCGAHSSRRVELLLTACRSPSRRGVEALRRLRRGEHPHERRHDRADAAWHVINGGVGDAFCF